MRSVLPSVLIVAACGGAKPEVTVPAPPPTGAEAAPAIAKAEPAAAKPAAPALAKATKVRSVEGITEYRLDNGLQVLLFPDQTQSTVTVNITYLVGSRLEGYGETGMAHLLEHMMFKGSARHRNVLNLLEERGGQANGTTDLDRTNYFETLPASHENLEWALDLESDRMVNAMISPDDLKTEFSVVRNEFERDEDSPQRILGERISESAYLWHNYGKSVIGSRSDIERVPVPSLRAFYTKYYQPDNAVLVVSGKFEDSAALASIVKTFGAVPRPSRTLAQTYTIEPVQDGERRVELRRNGEVSVVGLGYHTLAGSSPDFPAVDAALDILTRKPSGRLYKKLIETKLAASIYGWTQQTHDPSLSQLYAEIRDPKNVDKVEQIMIAEIESLASGKIDDKELERWRTATLKEIELGMANSQEVAVYLSEFAAIGDWRTFFAYRDHVAKVTVADVQRVAKDYFKASNRTVGRFVPTKDADRAPLTTAPDVQELVKGVEGGEVKEAGEVFAATLDNIESRTQRSELKGGIKAALLAKKTRGGRVALSLQLHWGDDKALQNKRTVGSLLGAMMVRGTQNKSFQDIHDLEDQLKARIWITSQPDGLTLHIETLRDKLAGALDLAAEMMTSPTFPDKELELVRQERLASLEQQLSNPQSLAFTTFSQLMSPWTKSDPRYPETPAEQIDQIKKVKASELRQFYKDFAGAGHGELAVVGDFEPGAVSAQVEKLFATWQTKKHYARLIEKPSTAATTEKSLDIKDKENVAAVFGFGVAMKDSDPDYPAWLMLSQVLGGDTGSRLWFRLREHEGLSYGVGTWSYADALDEAGGFGGYAIFAPQNLGKAKTSLREEIAKIATGKVEDKELQHAKDAWIKEQDTNLSDDDYVMQMLSQQLFHGRTAEFTKELRAKIQAVTPADVDRVAHKWFDPKRLVFVDAGDHAKEK
jgi:zinc protease